MEQDRAPDVQLHYHELARTAACSYRTIVELISATETKSLKLRADLDPRTYATKVRVSDAELATVPLEPHTWHGEWNYTIRSHAQSIER